MQARTRASLLGAILIATGCGYYRTGYLSMPYVGEPPPSPEAPGEGPKGWDHLRYLSLRGVTLYINLLNDVDTTRAPWIGIGEPRVVRMRHCISLDLRPEIPGISLEPKLVSLSVNGVPHAAETVVRYIGTGSRSEEVREARIALAQDQWTRFGLCFPEAAAPDQNITLDLGRALRHPDNLPFPLIKFKMQRFRHLYSRSAEHDGFSYSLARDKNATEKRNVFGNAA